VYAQLRESLVGLPSATKEHVSPRPRVRGGVSRNVIGLGFTSLFTDISSEMVSSVLPMYMVLFLRLSPLQFGVIDGLYQGVGALVKIGFGFAADRLSKHKEVAFLGYALSAVCKAGLLAAGASWGLLSAVIVADRTGKGIRTAPRDALISLSTPGSQLGMAFGVHRALDTVGAMIGPLLAFALLALIPNAFDVVFVASLGFALVGLAVLGLFVENATGATADKPKRSFRAALRLIASPQMRGLIIAGTALGLTTISDAFIYLGLQQRLTFSSGLLPLLYVVTSVFYFVLAVPMGRLADRIGRAKVFVGGYALLLIVYSVMLLPGLGMPELLLCLALFGAYYAATDGVLMALASPALPADLRTSGMALLTTATSVARLLASVAFGALWTVWGVEVATVVFLGGLVIALIVTLMTFRARRTATAEVAA
jgi:MFS family permease